MQISPMGTDSRGTPRASLSLSTLFLVRLLVPNPGMVYALIPEISRPASRNASTVTSRARVESSPPEKSDNHIFTADVKQPAGKACALNGEYFPGIWPQDPRKTAGTKGLRAKLRIRLSFPEAGTSAANPDSAVGCSRKVRPPD